MEILIKNSSVTRVLEEIADAYRALCPGDYEAFIAKVKEESHSLIKSSGLSAEGHFMNLMKIPVATNSRGESINLYSFIKHQMQKRCNIADFFADRENYYLLCKVWADAHVKTKHRNKAI